eukprot:TRINITY_DN4199_c0_g1_i1.p1 TRINITY_DN4199_c0_g1~~TRINITY_DN4199_c0_g1_i1.p1  ORF type:complete len:335 (-),score=68.21 TRINITY_DN4199_c0_g1_i1:86-1090(-)
MLKPKKFLGFIHLIDLLTFITQIYTQNTLEDDLYSFLERDTEFSLANSKAIIDLSHKNPFIRISPSTPVRTAINHFLSASVHRMAVIPDSTTSPSDIKILTRAMIFQFLTQRIRRPSISEVRPRSESAGNASIQAKTSPSKPNTPVVPLSTSPTAASGILSSPNSVRQSNVNSIINSKGGSLRFISEQLWTRKLSSLPAFGTSPVVTISADKPTIEALSLLTKHRLSSLAVLSPEDGKLLSHLSATDIKVLVKEVLFTKIYTPVRSFIQASRAQETNEFPPAIYALESDTFGHLVELFQATKIHRLFIVDQNTRPVRAVSLTDIIKVIMSHLDI